MVNTQNHSLLWQMHCTGIRKPTKNEHVLEKIACGHKLYRRNSRTRFLRRDLAWNEYFLGHCSCYGYLQKVIHGLYSRSMYLSCVWVYIFIILKWGIKLNFKKIGKGLVKLALGFSIISIFKHQINFEDAEFGFIVICFKLSISSILYAQYRDKESPCN